MNPQNLSERDICTKFITPALYKAGWDMQQIFEEYSFTAGRIVVRGKLATREQRKRADYVLFYKPRLPIAVIEAKKNSYAVGDGMQQALAYAEALEVPFAFSSNGNGFVCHDRTGSSERMEGNLAMDAFPSPDNLWVRYRAWKGLNPEAEEIVLQDYHEDAGGKTPRYYQVNAINAVTEAIAKGRDRILLVMATGTGKTYTAFQIIWRLWKAGRKKRILFLADRKVLVDQARVNDFSPFGKAMAKLSTQTGTITRDGENVSVDHAYEVYLALYQSITGPEDHKKIYRKFSPSFFDLIVIDECHRGSADEDSVWREILEYFSSATQIGLTATPKETKYISNIAYFGDPIFSYSLKQGIHDGFLAPYKVIKVHIDLDIDGYRPKKDQLDRDGVKVDDRIFGIRDFDRTLVIDGRTKLVAQKITAFLKESSDRFQKSIIFCVDQEHAARMRQALINENADLVGEDVRYVMRITGDDQDGQNELDNFIDPESRYPVLVTTSRLLSTGVDVQTCRLIVLDRNIGSMTEFKQIVGRGTRVHEDTHKHYFTLLDFRGATNHFADPEFDGDPVQIYTPKEDEPIAPPLNGDSIQPTDLFDGSKIEVSQDPLPPRGGKKIYIDGIHAHIIAERVVYVDKNGRPRTETLRGFTKKKLRKRFSSLDDFLMRWSGAERKQAMIDGMQAEGLVLSVIAEELGMEKLDPFDLICYIAFDSKPLTRRERAENVKKLDVFTKYGRQCRNVLDKLLDKYADDGVLDLDNANVLRTPPFNMIGTPLQLIRRFGNKRGFKRAVRDLQTALYKEAA